MAGPRRSSPSRVKLRHRLPNAPPLFVGRGPELDWLEAAIRRGPVTVVTGPGGIGKTALALRVLHERFSDVVPKAVYFGIRPGETTDQLRFDLVRVLSQSARTGVDLAAIATDPEALTETAIDLAEAAGFLVVLDDAHHADAEEMTELLTQLVSYARDSRWLVTSLTEVRVPQLAGQWLPLKAMGEAELTELARYLAPTSAEADLHRAVNAASGSPWLLAQYLETGQAGVELTRERLLENLPPQVEPFLFVLSLLRIPVSPVILGGLTTVPDEAVLAQLERRGLVQRFETGLRLHDVVSGHLFPLAAMMDDSGRREAIAAALETVGDPELVVEAARLLSNAGALDALADLLQRRAEELFAHAHAPRLWAVIGGVRDERLLHHQLRCAAEMGNPTALASVREPSDPGPWERLAWAQMTYAQGNVARARALAGELHAIARDSKDEQLAVESALLGARCLLHDAQPELAIRELDLATTEEPGLAFRRDALRVRCQSVESDPMIDKRIAELLRRGEAAVDGLDGLHDLALALYDLGRHERADEVLDALVATPRGGRASLLVSRKALLLRARIRLVTGSIPEASDLLESVRPYARTASLLRPFLIELDSTRRLLIGDLEGLETQLQIAQREGEGIDRRLTQRIATLLERLGIARGQAPVEALAPALLSAPTPTLDAHSLVLLRLRRACRHGVDAGLLAPAAASDASARVHALLLRCDEALVRGDVALAVETSQHARAEAARAGNRVLELDALSAVCDALLLAAQAELHSAAARELLDLARALGSARGRLEAELNMRHAHPATLERIAACDQVAPTAARRARALLGGEAQLDLVDRRVIEAVLAREPTLRIVGTRSGPSDGWEPGWGLDERHQLVWLPDGREVDLSSRALLWRILSAVCGLGGAATKEQLLVGVWQERVYHPGRHDPRLHMSARKLREMIEDDPSNPTRLVTTEDGYRLDGVLRRIPVS